MAGAGSAGCSADGESRCAMCEAGGLKVLDGKTATCGASSG